MLLNLTDLSSESLQSQIARQIRAKILAGELAENYSLPSIRGLASEQKVSVITVQRAYELLMRENLIHSRRGKGFFVSPLHKTEKKDLAIQRLVENIRPQLDTALDEGLAMDDVLEIVKAILDLKK